MTAHGYGPYTNGCRCEVCREAKRVYTAERRAETKLLGTVPAGVRHGSVATYDDYHCRCTPCVEAKRAVNRASLDRQRRSSDVPHGTYKGYSHYACRCDACRGACSRYYRNRRAASAAA